jgi:flagellar basal-body rod protein FlgB
LVIWDVTAVAAVRALDGLAQRGQVRAHNIANSETPNFRASHVSFEATLRDAVRQGRPERATTEVVASPTVIDANDNSVDLETEMIGAMQDGLMRDTMINGFNFKAAQLRVAFGGRR